MWPTAFGVCSCDGKTSLLVSNRQEEAFVSWGQSFPPKLEGGGFPGQLSFHTENETKSKGKRSRDEGRWSGRWKWKSTGESEYGAVPVGNRQKTQQGQGEGGDPKVRPLCSWHLQPATPLVPHAADGWDEWPPGSFLSVSKLSTPIHSSMPTAAQ